MRISRQTLCLAAVLALANGQAGAQQSAQISIRVIDTDHRPLPNITVEMREVTGCYRPDKSKLATLTRSADDGTATFNISVDARYALIRGGLKDSGLEERQHCVSLRFSDQSSTAYVELQLRPDPLHWAETIIPAKNAPPVRELPVATFAAPFSGPDGVLVFHVSGSKVLSFDFTRRHVSAKYVEPWK